MPARFSVCSDDDPALRICAGEHLVVGGALKAEVGDVHGVMACFGEDAREIVL